MFRRAFRALLGVYLIFSFPGTALPYSVQTHEQIIDLVWLQSIQPLLLARYPTLTPAQLQEAHAYAYGGSAIQDLGYYPFGNPFYSDITHYVRPGDFVLSLIRNAQNANDLAFAIGALSHYLGDTIGHSIAINPSVPIEFPKLAKRYGNSVTYEQSEHGHVRTEFAFDIDQISKHRFTPLHYLRHVGLGVPTPLLGRVFFEVYGLDEQKTLGHGHPALRGYQFAIRSFLPRIAYAETILHRHDMPPDTPSPELDKFLADFKQASADNGWEPYRRKPGIGTYSLAGILRILPKVGILSDLSIKGPVPFTEDLYVVSLNRTVARLRALLADFNHIGGKLPNLDLDTGTPVRPGAYRLADQTYATLLERVTATPTQPVPPVIKRDLLAYFADPASPIAQRGKPQQWAKIQTNLTTLAAMPTTKVIPDMDDLQPITPP